jgi:hypothetical protein
MPFTTNKSIDKTEYQISSDIIMSQRRQERDNQSRTAKAPSILLNSSGTTGTGNPCSDLGT